MSNFAFKNLTNRTVSEVPGGLKNGVNLDFTTIDEFIAGTLEVYLGGDRVCPEDIIESGNLNGFTLTLSPNDPGRLGSPPEQFERIVVDYQKNIKCA